MKAIVYNVKPAGWAACKCLSRLWRGCVLSPLGGLSLRERPAPTLPGEDWVIARTLLGGICGTDLAIIAQKQRPNSLLQAFSSMPMVLGHENVAVVEQVGPAVDPSWVGRRVNVEPTLGCTARGIDPPCPRCQAGEFGACERFGESGGKYRIPPGTSIGYNATTGGAFGERFVAHVSQLVPVPQSITDEQAVLVDPLACSLHAVLRADLSAARRVLVYGAGVLGLGVVEALRATGFAGEIHALDRAGYLEPLVMRMGADRFLRLPPETADRYRVVAELTGATVHRARFGNFTLSGGYDAVFECVGSGQSLNESLRWTRSRGQVVLVGTGDGAGVDLTPIWFTELTVLGAYGRQMERQGEQRVGTYQLVHELMTAGKLRTDGLLTHLFPLSEYRKAFEVGLQKGRHQAVKVAFDFRRPAE